MDCHHYVKKPILVESQYFPPITYFSLLISAGEVWIDGYENMVKATYRNRCHITTPDGVLALSVPLAHGRHQRRAMKDVRIFNELDWQKKHWDTLCSAYRRSPYFEYYEDSLYQVFYKPYTELFDLNNALVRWILATLKLDIKIHFTRSYESHDTLAYDDWRSRIHPHSEKNHFPPAYKPLIYHQVFEDRLGFIVDLSMLDLLFACGPRAKDMLEENV